MTPGPITERVVTAVRSVLDQVRDGFWGAVALEVQEGGNALLISIDIPELPLSQVYARYCQPLRAALSGVVPKAKDDYAWTVVFLRDGKVIESCLPSAF